MRAPEPRTDSLKAYFLEANPNPERIDCPPEGVVQAAAENRVGAEHPVRLHLASCSECYAEFRGYKLDWERRRAARTKTMGWAVAAAAIIGIVSGVIAVRHLNHRGAPEEQIARVIPPPTPSPNGNEVTHKPPLETPPVPPQHSTKADEPTHHPPRPPDHAPAPSLDGDKDEPTGPHPITRPDGPAPPAAPLGGLSSVKFDLRNVTPVSVEGARSRGQLVGLRAAVMSVALLLPDTAESGAYEVRVAKDSAGNEPIESAHGNASREDGVLNLKVSLTLTGNQPGDYYLLTIHEGDHSTRSYSVRVDR